MCAGAGTSVSSGLSVDSSNHSGRSHKRSSASRQPSLFFMFVLGFLRVIHTTFVGLVRHFALELDLLTNPAVSMLTTNCSQNWWITLEQREVRSCPQEYPWSSQSFPSDRTAGVSSIYRATRNMNSSPFCDINTSFTLILRG